MNRDDTTIKLKLFSTTESSIKKGKEYIVEGMVSSIQDDDEIGFAGYLDKKDLQRDLLSFIFGLSELVHLPDLKPKEEIIFMVVRSAIEKCKKKTKIPPLTVFIFPTQDTYVIESMGGVNGFTPYRRALHIYMNPNTEDEWQKHLSETVVHEVAHILSREEFEWNTILDSLIFEGLAEHFRELVLGGEKAPWATAIESNNALKIIEKLEEEQTLEFINNDLYIDLFFGSEKFSKWSGYTMGYIIIEKILESEEYSVLDLLKKEPSIVFVLYKKMAQTLSV